MLPDAIAALLEIKTALDGAGIEYMVVGSLASSAHGLPRATRDADLVVNMAPAQIASLVALLEPKFYVSADAASDAIRHGTSFNAIHEETFFQIDLFVANPSPFNRSQFNRRQQIELDPDHSITMPFQSAEDTILSKLDWFRQGNEVSERQWQDILDILRAQGEQLDHHYLRQWAANLGVDDLLRRALAAYQPNSEQRDDSPF
jgi:hypothetical protein